MVTNLHGGGKGITSASMDRPGTSVDLTHARPTNLHLDSGEQQFEEGGPTLPSNRLLVSRLADVMWRRVLQSMVGLPTESLVRLKQRQHRLTCNLVFVLP